MRKLLIIFFVFMTFQNFSKASTADWSDIELNQQYRLSLPISFPGIPDFQKGEKIEILDYNAGEGSVIYYLAHYLNCKNPDLEAEMILVNPNPEDRGHDHSVGILLETGCNLGIFIEPTDYFSQSIFDHLNN
ncbi:MAG: hypothetical protein Q7U04_05925 [Bacteriovorax sp.]|nr:hypothetical protein [Bacteriovorax sp.]